MLASTCRMHFCGHCICEKVTIIICSQHVFKKMLAEKHQPFAIMRIICGEVVNRTRSYFNLAFSVITLSNTT